MADSATILFYVDDLAPVPEVARSSRPRSPSRWNEGRVAFLLAALVYLTVGAVLVFGFDAIVGDSMARNTNGAYVVAGRDPHLAAVGSVWQPLPSLLVVPLLVLGRWWSPLVTHAFAMSIVMALCMAASVAMILTTLREMGVGRSMRRVLSALFGLHPMVLLHGSSGMSEAAFLLGLVAGCRYALRWYRTDQLRWLGYVGVIGSLTTLTRYEALSSFAGLACVVFVLGRRRGYQAVHSPAIAIAVPVVVTALAYVGVWSVLSRGLSEGLATIRDGQDAARSGRASIDAIIGSSTLDALVFRWKQTLALSPAIVVVLVAALRSAHRRIDGQVLLVLAIFSAPLVFHDYYFASSQSFGWMRFSLPAVAMTTMLLGLLVADAPQRRRVGIGGAARWRGMVVLAALLPFLVTPVAIVRSDVIGREEHLQLDRVWWRLRSDPRSSVASPLDHARTVARFLDDASSSSDLVVLDVGGGAWGGFAVYASSSHPHRFVKTPDVDYLQLASDPTNSSVRFIVARDPAVDQRNPLAVDSILPGMWERGAGIARRVFEAPGWRVYELASS